VKLFYVSDEIERILAQEVDEYGEIQPEAADYLSKLEMEKETLILELIRYKKGEEAEAKGIKEAAKELTERAKIHERRAAWIEACITARVEPGEAYSDPTAELKWTKSEVCELTPEIQKSLDEGRPLNELVEGQWLKTTYAPKIADAKAALKLGQVVKGFRLRKKRNLKLK